MSKGGSQTVTQTLDSQTQAYVNQLRRAALGYAGMGAGGMAPAGGGWAGRVAGQLGAQYGTPFTPPPNPALDAAQAQYGQYANAGSQGLTALLGGANPFMNAYSQTLDPIWNQIRQQTLSSVGDQATLAGAFGGSRQGVAEGQALGDIANAQATQRYGEFSQAQQRAMQLAQLGYGAQAMSAFLPQQFASGQLGLLQQGLGPYGTSQTMQTQNDPFSQLLGLGLTAGGFFLGGPAGAAAGHAAGQYPLR